MKILALETATATGGVALLEDDRVLFEIREKMAMKHAEKIMVLVDRALKETGTSLESLDGLAVSIGPGSFTGLRVGVNTAKGLSGGQELLAVPVSTLEVLAGNFPEPGTLCCPMLDARKGEVYTAFFRTGNDGFPVRLTEDGVRNPEDAVQAVSCKVSESPASPIIFCGDGAEKYASKIQGLLAEGAVLSLGAASEPSPVVLARLGLRRLRDGQGLDVHHLEPVYIRRTEAEVSREKGLQSRGAGTPVRSGKGN